MYKYEQDFKYWAVLLDKAEESRYGIHLTPQESGKLRDLLAGMRQDILERDTIITIMRHSAQECGKP